MEGEYPQINYSDECVVCGSRKFTTCADNCIFGVCASCGFRKLKINEPMEMTQ